MDVDMSQNPVLTASDLPPGSPAKSTRIPLWFKLLYSAFVCVLVPYYWAAYGPTNFLYFCDMALLITAVALWTENPLLASMPAVGILLPQALWCIDFLGVLFGLHVIGLTDYMFKPELSLFTRGLSFFHFWLPFVLLWLVWRLGYDRRALAAWTGLAWILLLICYFLLPAPPAPPESPNLPVNVNYVYGFSDLHPQEWLPPLVYFAIVMVGLPIIIFLPTHFVLNKLFGQEKVLALPAAA
jgi:hypothetical protein